MKIVEFLIKVIGAAVGGAFMGGVFWYLGSMTLNGLQIVPCVIAGAVIRCHYRIDKSERLELVSFDGLFVNQSLALCTSNRLVGALGWEPDLKEAEAARLLSILADRHGAGL